MKFLFAMAAVAGTLAAQAGVGSVRVAKQFGFDAADSTRFIQAAIDSDAEAVVLDKLDKPWVTTALKARSGLKLIFAEGAELVAKPGAFTEFNCEMLRIEGVTNVVVCGRGKGGVIRMRKREYAKAPYVRSEHRHILSIGGGRGILVENMCLREAGGDGIVVWGNAENVTIRRVVCDDNFRQGISVLSAKDLLVEDCVLKNTGGTPPMAGIDFEPDRVYDALVNCVMRRCVIENNRGNGIDMYFGKSTGKTKPFGILVEDCRVFGNRHSSFVGGGVMSKPTHPQGRIVYRNCLFAGARDTGIEIKSKPLDAFQLVYEDCVVSNAGGSCDISVGTDRWDQPPVNGVAFPGLKTYRSKPGKTFGAGGLGTCNADNLPPRKGFPAEETIEIADGRPGERVPLSPVIIQERAHYVFFAERAGLVSFKARQLLRGKTGGPTKSPLRVSRMNRPKRERWWRDFPMPGLESAPVEFEVPGRGYYFMSAPTSSSTRFLLEESDVPVGLNVSTDAPLALPGDHKNPLSLWIAPINGDSFALVASGCSEYCRVKLSVFDPSEKLLAEEDSIHDWTPVRVPAPPAGLCRLDVSKPSKGCYFAFQLDLVGVTGILQLSKEKFIRQIKK